MISFPFAAVIALNTLILARNGYLIIKGRIEPSLAMWLFFTIAVVGSLFSYLLEGDFSPLDNILNTSDVVLCAVLTGIIFLYGGKNARFNRFEYALLAVVVLILGFWFLSKAHFLTNLSLQLIQFIAYLPVYRRMIRARRNTESFTTWILLLAVSLVSLFTARGVLALVYSLRATVCVAILLTLMTIIRFRSRTAPAGPRDEAYSQGERRDSTA